MNLTDYIDFDTLFITICVFIAIQYFNTEKPNFVLEYQK